MTTDEAIAAAVRAGWMGGYQMAVQCMRDWAEKFGTAQTRAAVLTCAKMVEAAKPVPDQITGK